MTPDPHEDWEHGIGHAPLRVRLAALFCGVGLALAILLPTLILLISLI